MNLELRLAALSTLVDAAKSDAIDARLAEEFARLEQTLTHGDDYDSLSDALQSLAVLAPRFHQATVPLLQTFVRGLAGKTLTQGGAPLGVAQLRYRSAFTLMRDTIEVARRLSYVHTEQVVDFLLWLSQLADEDVRSEVARALEALAEFNLDIFYGEPPRGAEPQARIVAHLAGFTDAQLLANAALLQRILGAVLKPSMEGTSWTYRTVTIRRGGIVSEGGVAQVRVNAIELLKRVYALDPSVDFRRGVLQNMDSATRRERTSDDPATVAMFERDALTVLAFLRERASAEPLPLVQAIEHQAYWNYYHAISPAVQAAALQVRDAIDAQAEYQIYKQLIGFEGIFGAWEELRRSEAAWEYGDTHRREAARQYVTEINDANYERWRDRILEFSKTRSNDLAMFPVYYDFLESIGRERPRLALELVTAHEAVMEPFLIALLRGLWESTQESQVQELVQRWIEAGVNLTVIAKSLYKVGAPRIGTLSAVRARAAALNESDALVHVMGVAASLHAEGSAPAKDVFMQALRDLARRDDASWASVIWFNRDFRTIIDALLPAERSEVLSTMASLPKIDYRAEEVLSAIAQHDVQAVLDFLMGRLQQTRVRSDQNRTLGEDVGEDRFEAIPYQLHKLNALLAKAPQALVEALKRDFGQEDRLMFTYRGARLIKAVFPALGGPLEELLLRLVEDGDQDDIDYVVAIMRTYDGNPAILPVCKAIVQRVPERSGTWNELAAAIESTGVVSGEYGLVHAYERKRSEISAWLADEDVRVRAFAQWLTDALQRMVELERQRADEGLALRKYRFGDDEQEA